MPIPSSAELTPADHGVAILRLRGIEKSYPGVRALRGVDLDLFAGEVHALLGENGAGKSTLVQIIAGATRPDAGTIELDGQPANLRDPVAAARAGIAVMYQEFNLVPQLSLRANLFLGRGSTIARLHHDAERRRARELFARLGTNLDPDSLVKTLRVAEQQIVEIARALADEARVLIMDEPTAALSQTEVDRLFEILAKLCAEGIGVLFISHRLEEVRRIADRVSVLRDGCLVDSALASERTRAQWIEAMVGRPLDREFPPRTHTPGKPLLQVRALVREPAVRGVSFELRAGEVLGLTGLVGSGRTELARLLFGADRASAGCVELDGKIVRLAKPRDGIANGICLLTEDRKRQGLCLGRSTQENFSLPNLPQFTRAGWLRRAAERRALQGFVESLAIRPNAPEQRVRHLSGGNQQKLVLAKWLQQDARVLIFDEPTRGVDVGAKYEIHALIDQLAGAGKGILVISSELPEVLGICDRVLVMRDGRIVADLDNDGSLTPEQLLGLAIGATPTETTPTETTLP